MGGISSKATPAEILVCEPPSRLEITWVYGGDTSWVTVEVGGEPEAGEATLELRHVAHVPDDLRDQYGPGAFGIGWDLALLGLDLHVPSGAPIDPYGMQQWRSSEGREFVVRSSAAWGDASIAAGTDPAMAKASADRTTQSYADGE